ncbi:hypothetical protein ACFFHM_14870 [Halalkalibacter kiskunsagensis]|uniref:Uncharacterized protein n=1 Tax=Halalkalibacter kiskunsagensis TaxID=1548599 RepID=A0ABV6KEJ3_9BACI
MDFGLFVIILVALSLIHYGYDKKKSYQLKEKELELEQKKIELEMKKLEHQVQGQQQNEQD